MALTNKLTNIADAIRTKNGTSAKLSLDDMASSILAIESGSGIDTSDATATAGDIVSGKTAYVNAEKITGTLSTLQVAPGTPEYNTSPDQIKISTSLTEERYIVENTLSLTAKASDFGDAVPSDVVSGKTFTSASGLKLTGTREESGGSSGGLDTSDATATADDIIANKTAYVNGEKITGNIVRYNGTTYTPTTEDERFFAGAYNSDIIVKGDVNLLPENIRQGVSIFNVEGTLSPYEDTDSTATAENIESGYTAYVKGERITGSLETGVQANLLANSTTYSNEGSVKYSTSTGTGDVNLPSRFTVSYKNNYKRVAKVNDTISANVRASLFGNATVNDVVKGKTFSSENGLKLTGNYEGSTPTLQEKTITPSEESQSVTPDSGYDGLSQVTIDAISSTYVGSGVTKKSATTYTPGTSDQTIVSGQYLNGTQTIKGDSNLVAGNIKSGVSIFGVSGSYVGSGGSSGGLVTKSGTTTSATIETGLSSIKMLLFYTDSFSSTGFIQGTYVADDGIMHYTYCSSYSSYMKICGVTTSTSCTVNGGTFTLNASHELISGKTYNWIAVGEV